MLLRRPEKLFCVVLCIISRRRWPWWPRRDGVFPHRGLEFFPLGSLEHWDFALSCVPDIHIHPPWFALHRFQAFNNESIRTVAACREALTEARYEAEQLENDSSADGTDAIVKVTANAVGVNVNVCTVVCTYACVHAPVSILRNTPPGSARLQRVVCRTNQRLENRCKLVLRSTYTCLAKLGTRCSDCVKIGVSLVQVDVVVLTATCINPSTHLSICLSAGRASRERSGAREDGATASGYSSQAPRGAALQHDQSRRPTWGGR